MASKIAFILVVAVMLLGTPAVSEEKVVSTGWEAVNVLMRGNQRFVNGKGGGVSAGADSEEISEKPSLKTAIITCSDGRLLPELIFDVPAGSFFVVRSAGMLLDSSGRGSVEYALQQLDVQLLLVLASERCTMTKYAFAHRGEAPEGAGIDLKALTKSVWQQAHGRAGYNGGMQIAGLVKAITGGAVRQLVESSDIVRAGVGRGELLVAEAEYKPDSKRVSFHKVGYPQLFDYRLRWMQTPGKGPQGGKAKGIEFDG